MIATLVRPRILAAVICFVSCLAAREATAATYTLVLHASGYSADIVKATARQYEYQWVNGNYQEVLIGTTTGNLYPQTSGPPSYYYARHSGTIDLIAGKRTEIDYQVYNVNTSTWVTIATWSGYP